MILSATMATLLSTCAPSIGQKTMAGIVEYESGWNPWAIGDNTAGKRYYMPTEAAAQRMAIILLSEGHNLDVGLAQINSANFPGYSLTPVSAFDPCTNIHTGASILHNGYMGAIKTNWLNRPIITPQDQYLQQQYALMHAFSAYNTDHFWGNMKYAVNVYALAAKVTFAKPPISPPPTVITSQSTIAYQQPRGEQHPVNTHRVIIFQPSFGSHDLPPSPRVIYVTNKAKNWSTKTP